MRSVLSSQSLQRNTHLAEFQAKASEIADMSEISDVLFAAVADWPHPFERYRRVRAHLAPVSAP
jgi:hypothetical protein